MADAFRYTIRSKDIITELVSMGFARYHVAPDYTVLEAPTDISTTKARRLISTQIALHKAEIEYEISRGKYNRLVEKINNLNGAR